MSKYATLIARIVANIKRNGAQSITGDLLQEQLLAMITSLGEYYQFGGLASPSAEFTPGDEPVVFVAATPGTYTNFGGLVVADGEVALLVWSGSAWSKQTTDIATRSEVSQLGQKQKEEILKDKVRGSLILNKYVGSNGNIGSGNGWCYTTLFCVRDCVIELNSDNSLGYYLYSYALFDESMNFLTYNELSASEKYGFSLNSKINNYPTAKYILVDIWNSASPHTAPLVDGDVADLIVTEYSTKFDDLTLRVANSENDIADLQFAIEGITKKTFNLGHYFGNSGQIADNSKWACVLMNIEAYSKIIFQDTTLGYYFWTIILFDENNNFIALTESYEGANEINLTSLKTSYPNFKIAGINICNLESGVVLTPSNTADWVLLMPNESSLVEGISKLNTAVSDIENQISNKELKNTDLTLGQYLSNITGQAAAETKWAYCIIKIDGLSKIIFGENALQYAYWSIIMYDEEMGYIAYTEAFQGTREIDVSYIISHYPSAKYVGINFWNSSDQVVLTPQNTSDWSVELVSPTSIESQLGDIDTRLDSIENDSKKSNLLHFVNEEARESFVLSKFNEPYDFKNYFYIKDYDNLSQNPVFQFRSAKLVNRETLEETLVHSCGDDICPADYNGTYIGGGHGDSDVRTIVCTNHGKTFADIGSIWTDGDKQCTLIAVVDANTLRFLGENTQIYPLFSFDTSIFAPQVTLTHVSGATHTNAIMIESATMYQWHPCCVADRRVYVDDVEIVESGDYCFNKLKICEYYDVFNPASVLEKIQEAVGTFTDNPMPNSFVDADKVVRHSIVYEYDSAFEIKINTSFIAYQNIDLNYFGFTQQGPLEGNIRMYIPKVLPISNGQEEIDFRTIVPYNSVPSTMNIYDTYWEKPLLPPDRWIQISPNVAISCGYLFDFGVGGNNRKDMIANAFYLYTSRKCYPHGIDWKIDVNAGDVFSAVTWRIYRDVAGIDTNGIIDVNCFEYNDNLYVYADFNQPGVYSIKIPGKYVGKQIQVFEKSDNVELLMPIGNVSTLVRVTQNTPMYGYLVAKINP